MVALESHAQGAQRDVVNTWTFTWSDETQKALSLTTTWRKDNSNVCFYEVATNNEQIKINNEDIIPGLTFTASKSNIGLRSSGLHLAGNSSTRIHLASLSAGNIVKITSSGGSSSTAQYIEPESVSDETIKVKEAVDGTNTKSQTYSFEVVAENSYNFKLNGSASLQIQKMEVYENADASNPIEGKSWDFQSLYSTQFTETVLACLPIKNNSDGMRWSKSDSKYDIGSTLESKGPLKIWQSTISETNGLTFTTTATGNIRIMLESSNSLMLINDGEVTVTIPSVPAGGRVSIKTHVAGRVTDNSGNAPSSTENSGKDYIFDIASAGDFTFKITGDVKIYSICVEGPETTATALTPENVSVASVTYNGSEQTAVVKYNSETLTRGTDYTVTGTDALTDAGNTTFSITGSGNYTGSVSSLTFTITPKEVTVTGGITANNKVYDGNTTATLVLTGATIDGKVGEDELIVSSATGSFADANVSENKDVTISDITLGGVKAGNYTLSATGNQTTTTATITQATNALIGTLAIEGWTYGTTANLPSGVSATFGEVVYKYSNAENGEYGTYDDIVNGVVGTWWVKAFVEGTVNYTAAESSPVSFTISSVATTISVTAQDYSGTYDGAAHGISVTAEEGATITYRTTDSGEYNLTENPTYTNVGSYIVYYKVTKDNCEDVTGSKTVTITRAAGSINAFDPASGSVAMGTTDFAITTNATGDGTITYSSGDENIATINATTGAVTPVAAGTTTITATVTDKDGGNYTYAADSKTATYQLTVTSASVVENLTAPKVARKDNTTITITIGSTDSSETSVTTYYSTDGNDPSESNGTAITQNTDITLDVNCTVKAITISSAGNQSSVASYNYVYVAPVSETIVSTDTKWSFDEVNLVAQEKVIQDLGSGLIYRGNSGASVKDNSKNGTFTDAQSTTWSCTKAIELPAASDNLDGAFANNQRKANANYNGTLARALAFNVSGPGTCYVVFSADDATEGKAFKLFFNYKDGSWTSKSSSMASSTELTEVKLEADREGTFWIYSSQKCYVHSILFVPKKYTITEETSKSHVEYIVSPTTASAGQTITVTASPEDGYYVSSIKYTYTEGETTKTATVSTYSEKIATITKEFSMPAYDITMKVGTQKENLSLTAAQVEHGSISFKDKSGNAITTAKIGDQVTVVSSPDENYTLSSLSAVDAKGNSVSIVDNKFTMPAYGVTVTATFVSTTHTHSFSCEVGTGDNTNVLTATCQTAGCDLTGSKATLTLTADGGTYSGSAFAATTDLDAFNQTTGLSATCSINYTGDNEYNNSDAPTNVGNYTAKATITSGETPYILTKTFAISQQSLIITAKDQTITVGGNIAMGVNQVTAEGLVEGDELTGITLEPSSTAAVTTEGTITPKDAVIKNGAANYDITYKQGKLTITEVPVTTYNITVPAAVNGNSITADVSSAAENATVTLTITTASGYSFKSISAKYADNGTVTLEEGSDGTRTFTMPAADVTITATWTISQTDSQDSNTSETYTVTESGGIEVSQVTSTEGATSITISADKVGDVEVTSIADDAFNSIENKSAIKSVNLSATKITGVEVSRSIGVFSGFPEETMIYMPAGNTAAGQKNVIIGGTCSDFEMKDQSSYNIPKAFTATKATLSRSFTSEKYCTLCLPYDVPATNLGGKIYEFSSIEGTTVKMTEDTNGLNANKPYIFVPNSNANSISASSVTISMSSDPKTPDTSGFTFNGVFGYKLFSSTEITNGVYGFAADSEHGASVGQFVKASSGAWIEGMRAYLAYNGDLNSTSTASTRGMALPEVLNVVLVHANGSTTSIGKLELMTAEDGSPVYNLSGQRVDKSYKGIVIQNGKKMIKK